MTIDSHIRLRLRVWRGLCLALCAIALIVSTRTVHAQQPEAQGRPPTPGNPATVYPAAYSARWIADDDFVYGPALLDFDLRAFLTTAAPHLVAETEFIAHWCGYHSISPKVLLTVIEMRTGLLSRGAPLDDPFGGLVPGPDFQEQVGNALAVLAADFYAFRDARAPSDPGALNAATYALLNLFRAGASPASFAASVPDLRTRFAGTYAALFPGGAPAPPGLDDPATLAAPNGFLQLPWLNGQNWFFNGVHTTSGVDPGVLSSIDFTRSWSLTWGNDTSTDFVVAAHAGQVTVFSSCGVRVTSPNGWATQYYHLDGLQVVSGQQVNANQTIGIYANTLSQALCQGGSSSGPHLHFSLLQNGAFAELNGSLLSSYQVHSGRYSYDYDPSFMWLERSGAHYHAYSHVTTSENVQPNLTVDNVGLLEGDSIPRNAVFTVSLSGASPAPVRVDFATANGSAIASPSSTFSNPSLISIPASGSALLYPSTITVAPGLGVVTNVVVTLTGFTHARPRDVDILLAGPAGQTVMLMSDAGGAAAIAPLTLTFDDLGPAVGAASLISSTYRPTNLDDGEGLDSFVAPAPAEPYGTSLAAFNGTSPTGDWRLFVSDDFAPNGGNVIDGWTLALSTTAAGTDYGARSGTLTIAAGATTGSIAIPINTDVSVESAETFALNLSNPIGGNLLDAQGIGTIINEDLTEPPVNGLAVKAIQLTELRALINDLRVARGLAPFSFTDATVTAATTPIRAVHIIELRQAVDAVYIAGGQPAPTYVDPALAAGATIIRRIHFAEIRDKAISAP